MLSCRAVAVRVVMVGALLAAAACGGEGASEERRHLGGLRLRTQHAEWAIVVCRDVAAWLHDLNAAAAPLPRQVAGADATSLRDALVGFFADATGRTDRLVTRVGSYGAPALEGGEETAAAFRAALAKARAAFAAGQVEAVDAPVTGPAAFQPALDRLQARIDEGIQTVRLAYARMEKEGPLHLRFLFGQRDECTPIYQDSPTGVIPVPPHAR